MNSTYSATATTKRLHYSNGDDYLTALRIHNDWWQYGDATNEPYRLGGQMVAVEG